jgi:hypothetical protein
MMLPAMAPHDAGAVAPYGTSAGAEINAIRKSAGRRHVTTSPQQGACVPTRAVRVDARGSGPGCRRYGPCRRHWEPTCSRHSPLSHCAGGNPTVTHYKILRPSMPAVPAAYRRTRLISRARARAASARRQVRSRTRCSSAIRAYVSANEAITSFTCPGTRCNFS